MSRSDVLALDFGGHAEIIQNGTDGVLINTLNAEDFMDGLLKICGDRIYTNLCL